MTWGEFKKVVEEAGVEDDDELWYIDIALDFPVEVEKSDPLGVAIS